jgi:hypothetical protein
MSRKRWFYGATDLEIANADIQLSYLRFLMFNDLAEAEKYYANKQKHSDSDFIFCIQTCPDNILRLRERTDEYDYMVIHGDGFPCIVVTKRRTL